MPSKEKDGDINHIIVHTGQHYDEEMSSDLFKSLNIPSPDYHLGINNCSHSQMIGLMMIELEKILTITKPSFVLVYGDCNTTLAGALVANKLGIKLVHIESGLRGFNKLLPEEVNRVIVDHIADIKCCPNKHTINNLKAERITNNVYITGNLQIDLLKNILEDIGEDVSCESILEQTNLIKNDYVLLTIHRHYNTNKETLKIIMDQCSKIDRVIFFPAHPRTVGIINSNDIDIPLNVKIHKPVNFLDMVILEKYAKLIITDSGGIQPEAHYLQKPCLTVRTETEWMDTIELKQNRLVNPSEIYENYMEISDHETIRRSFSAW